MASLSQFSKYDKNFRDLYSKVDPRILDLEGISAEKLDISLMAEKYFSEIVD